MPRRSAAGKLLTEIMFDLAHLRPLLDGLVTSVVSLAAESSDSASAMTAASWQTASALGVDQLTVPELATRMGRRRQTVQAAVDDLIAGGYASKLPNPRRTRSPFIALTAEGHQAFWDVAEQHAAWVNSKARSFTVEELRATAEVLERLTELLRADLNR